MLSTGSIRYRIGNGLGRVISDSLYPFHIGSSFIVVWNVVVVELVSLILGHGKVIP